MPENDFAIGPPPPNPLVYGSQEYHDLMQIWGEPGEPVPGSRPGDVLINGQVSPALFSGVPVKPDLKQIRSQMDSTKGFFRILIIGLAVYLIIRMWR